jgi:hypothetical protein
MKRASGKSLRQQKTGLKAYFMKFWSYWPPFLGMGIKIENVEGGYGPEGWKAMDILLKLRFWNANYVGTQFGGSLFAMTDPFLMLILMRRLGKGFVVWDKTSTIRFRRPGTTDCRVRFEVSDEEMDAIRREVLEKGQIDWNRSVNIIDQHGKVVAEVDKTLYIATRKHYESIGKRKSQELSS